MMMFGFKKINKNTEIIDMINYAFVESYKDFIEYVLECKKEGYGLKLVSEWNLEKEFNCLDLTLLSVKTLKNFFNKVQEIGKNFEIEEDLISASGLYCSPHASKKIYFEYIKHMLDVGFKLNDLVDIKTVITKMYITEDITIEEGIKQRCILDIFYTLNKYHSNISKYITLDTLKYAIDLDLYIIENKDKYFITEYGYIFKKEV